MSKHPLLFPLLAFLAGYFLLPYAGSWPWIKLLMVLGLLVIMWRGPKGGYAQSICVFLAFLLLGNSREPARLPKPIQDSFVLPAGYFEVEEIRRIRVQDFEVKARVYAANRSPLMVLLKVKAKANSWQNHGPGALFAFKDLNVFPLPQPYSPTDFNYGAYLNTQGMVARAQLWHDNIWPLSKNDDLPVAKWPKVWQHRLLVFFMKHPWSLSARQMLPPLLFGFKGTLQSDLRNAFAKSGTLHLLAVSGLHVGLIYTLLQFVFKRLLRFRKLAVLFVMGGIWLYAGITGFSVSVFRSAIMFSLVALVQNGPPKLKGSALMTAAVVLLFSKPSWLTDPGFQLSFSAVWGILFLSQPLKAPFPFKNRFLRWLAEGTAVSVAAQLATLPFVLYHFKQFPVYFLPANLVVIPLISLLMYLSLAALPILAFGFAQPLVKVLNYFIGIVEFLIESISNWPYSQMPWQLAGPSALALALLWVYVLYKGLNQTEKKNFVHSLYLKYVATALTLALIAVVKWPFLQNKWLVYTRNQQIFVEYIEGGRTKHTYTPATKNKWTYFPTESQVQIIQSPVFLAGNKRLAFDQHKIGPWLSEQSIDWVLEKQRNGQWWLRPQNGLPIRVPPVDSPLVYTCSAFNCKSW